MFIGRKEELKELEKIYIKNSFELFVLYGKAGSGKTTLLYEFEKFIEMNAVNAIDIIKAQANMIGGLKLHIDMMFKELKPIIKGGE